MADLQASIDELWERRGELSPKDTDAARVVEEAIGLLDSGEARVAEPGVRPGETVVHEWLKRAILLFFTVRGMETISDGPFEYADKLPLKHDFAKAGVRVVPGASARWGSFLDRGVILMPSYVNIGARVGAGTMVDTWATVGSCAQIGKDVHISGGAGIGGVLEPLQASPTIIEDGCFIGARSEVAEGMIVREGAVISMGVFLNASTPIIDRKTGEVHRGEVPAYSVVVSGSRPDPHGGPSPYCAVIMKTVDAQTRSKTSINELLRD
jgi:2,3,4,5-tetrahydropyridine-2,6-dicarboxylate N-succinyltransferase